MCVVPAVSIYILQVFKSLGNNGVSTSCSKNLKFDAQLQD